MKKLFSAMLIACALCTGIALVACQTSPTSSSMESAKATYVLITPGNGAPYTVMIPADHPDDAMVIGKAGAPTCADCIKDAKAYALTGKLDPVCKSCGAHREPVAVAPTSGHN